MKKMGQLLIQKKKLEKGKKALIAKGAPEIRIERHSKRLAKV